MLKVYSKNGKTIILDVESGIWTRMKTSFFEKYKNKEEFWSFLNKKYFVNYSKNNNWVDTIYFAVTQKCNLCCDFCAMNSNSSVDTNKEINIQTIKQKLPALLDEQINKVVITGGEPFENLQLLKILESLTTYISKEKITLQTNGLLLDEHKISELKKYIGAIEISIENIVLNLSLKEQMKKILKLIKEQNIPLSLSYVVTENNMKYFNEALKLVEQYNTYFSYRIAEPLGKGIKILNKFDVENAYKNTLKVELEVLEFILKNKLWDYKLTETEKGFLLPSKVCGAYSAILAIQPDGFIYPCINIKNNKFRLGNMKTDSYEDVKKLLDFSNIRDKNKKYFHIEYKEKCKSCFYKYFCNGYCGAHESDERGDRRLYSKYVCKIRKTYLFFEMFCVDNTCDFKQYIQSKKAYLLECLENGDRYE